MSEFKITEAAFAGYGLMARKPGLLLALVLFGLIINVAGYAVILNAAGPGLAQMVDMQRTGQIDPSAAGQLLGAVGTLVLIAILISTVSYMVSAGAVARAVIRPSTSKPPYVGLGADEFRLLAVGLVVGIILFLVSTAGSIVVAVISIGVAGATGGLQQMAENPGSQPAAMRLTTYIGNAIVYFLTFLLSVRFSLAPAQSEREEGIRIFGSWALTKGRYWRTTGAYLLALLSLVPIYAIATLINVGVQTAAGASLDDGIMAVMQPDWSSESIFAPTVLVYVVANSIAMAIAWIVCLASSATVYAKVEGTADVDVFTDDDDDDDDDDED